MRKTCAILLAITLLLMVACAKSGAPAESSPSPTSPSPATSSPSPTTSSPSPTTSSPSPAGKTPAAKTPAMTATKYKDGNYDEKGDPWAQGQEEAILIIKDGKIINVTLMRLDKAGKEIDYTKFDGKEHDGKLYPNLKEFKETLAKKIIEIQSSQIDTIAGATVTTGNWKVAVQKAIEKASKKEK